MRLKVWGMTLMACKSNRQERAIVAATSQRAAAEAFGITLHYLRGYGSETGNADEIEVAMSDPGVVFVQPLDERRPFSRRGRAMTRRPKRREVRNG